MRKVILAAQVAFWLITPTARMDAASFLRIDGSRGDFIGEGVVDVFDDNDGTFALDFADSRSAFFSFRGDGFGYGLEFHAPEGQPLAPGNYEETDAWTDDSPLRPALRVSSQGHACNTATGRFVVRELVRDSVGGEITSFAVDFEHYCDGQDMPLLGALRFQSAVPLDIAEPTAAAGADRVVLERDAVVLDGRKSMPGSASITDWRWRQVAGSPVTLIDSDQSIATFTATLVAAPGETLQFELRTVNDEGLVDTDLVDIFVQDKVSPRSAAFLIGDGHLGELHPNQELLLLPQDGLFEVIDHGEGRSVMHLQWRGFEHNWFFDLLSETPLAVGHHAVDSDVGRPYINVLSGGSTCSRVHGSFDILDIGFSGDRVSRIALNFEQFCESLQVPLRAKLRLNVAIPDADAGPDLEAEGRSAVSLGAAASEPAVGALSGYQWRQIAGHPVTLHGASSANASFTAPDVDAATILTFELTVTDDRGIDDSDIVAVQVMPSSSPPPPPPPSGDGGGDGGGGGGAANWAALAMLALLGRLKRGRFRKPAAAR